AKMGALARAEERWGFILISPWILGFIALTLGPILFSLGLSFCRWQSLASLSTAKLVGIENYSTAITGEDLKFWKSLLVTFRYTMLAVPLGVTIGLVLALFMNAKLKGITFFRTIYFTPVVLPAVAVTVLWWYLFNADSGWVNWLLSLLGIQGPAWLNDPRMVVYVFVLMSLWGVGGGMIIYLAGLQGIPTELYEAAQIDGASRWHQFLHVTLPMISPIIFFNLVMGIIGSFQVFTQAFVMYGGEGGPDDAALFYVLHLFIEAFEKYRLGYGSALAWILFVIILAFTMLIFKSSPLWVYYEGKREGAG
ncbi:MAG: carbohydrate ABC transporter permease, partial [Thermodesulfobacteriota bacterium]